MTGAGWIRSRPSKALLWAALVLSLVLGAGVLVVDRQGSAADRIAVPLTNDQAAGQVVGSARQIVAAARLQKVTGGYMFVSCATQNAAPYQAAMYMSFSLPHSDWARYLDQVASAMIVGGWAAAPAQAEHFGRKLTKGGVTAVLQRNLDDPTFATMRLYGECRNLEDHRNDNPAWTEVSL
ncbi:hypothetical protein AB4Z42_17215 [Mycobacterium sp. 2YAF39]|uniref:hypothetical protein n=1 Tax=Mycobacterium sp. 2YAF39 TaxID=3233033 RepID=UPI003F9437EB